MTKIMSRAATLGSPPPASLNDRPSSDAPRGNFQPSRNLATPSSMLLCGAAVNVKMSASIYAAITATRAGYSAPTMRKRREPPFYSQSSLNTPPSSNSCSCPQPSRSPLPSPRMHIFALDMPTPLSERSSCACCAFDCGKFSVDAPTASSPADREGQWETPVREVGGRAL